MLAHVKVGFLRLSSLQCYEVLPVLRDTPLSNPEGQSSPPMSSLHTPSLDEDACKNVDTYLSACVSSVCATLVRGGALSKATVAVGEKGDLAIVVPPNDAGLFDTYWSSLPQGVATVSGTCLSCLTMVWCRALLTPPPPRHSVSSGDSHSVGVSAPQLCVPLYLFSTPWVGRHEYFANYSNCVVSDLEHRHQAEPPPSLSCASPSRSSRCVHKFAPFVSTRRLRCHGFPVGGCWSLA
jgi:hypothetical protein